MVRETSAQAVKTEEIQVFIVKVFWDEDREMRVVNSCLLKQK